MRVYDVWLSAFRPSSYAPYVEDGFSGVATIFAGFVLFSAAVFCVSAFVGWLVAAIYGSCSLLLRKRE